MVALLLCAISSYFVLFLSRGTALMDEQSLYFSLSMPTQEFVSAVDQAVQDINNDSTILAGYKLQYVPFEHQCNSTKALDQIVEEILSASNMTTLAVIGCGCSAATEVVAKVTHFWNIPLVSYASSSSVLSDRSVYPSFFRTAPSDEVLVPALATLVNYYGWRQVAILTQTSPQFLQRALLLKQSLMNSNVNMSHLIFDVGEDLIDVANRLFEGQEHIMVLNTDLELIPILLCQGFYAAKFYPNYLWIVLDADDQGYVSPVATSNCSTSQMMHTFNRTLMLSTRNATTHGMYSHLTDAVWVVAKALNSCMTVMSKAKWCNLIQQVAITKWIDKNGDEYQLFNTNGNLAQQSPIVIKQYKADTDWVVVASVVDSVLLYIQEESIVWPEGVPPDGVPLDVTRPLRFSTVFICNALAACSLSFAFVCLLFNLVFRKKKIVKLNSPNLNYLLITGVMILTCSATNFGLYTVISATTECTIARVCAGLGYDICFLVILLKSFRIFCIFKTPMHNRKLQKDSSLLLILCGILSIDVLITLPLLTVTLFNGDISLTPALQLEPYINENGVEEKYYEVTCGTTLVYNSWVLLSILYKIILNVFGVILAYRNRNIPIDALNDSTFSSIIIYVSIALLVTIGLNQVMAEYFIDANVAEMAYSIFIVLLSINFLGLTFVSKMIALCKDPKGKDVLKSNDPVIQIKPTTGDSRPCNALNSDTTIPQKSSSPSKKTSHD